jgi:hypothetical protein
MTVKQFVIKIQAYYGLTYPEGQRDDLLEYLTKRSERWLDALYKAVIRNVSSQYKSLPDIAVFEQKEVREMATDFLDMAALEAPSDAPLAIEERYATSEEVENFLSDFMMKMRERAQ